PDRARAGDPAATRPPAEPSDAAALFLAADLAFLDANAGRGGWVEAATAYERALREAADFADAGRGWFQLGEARLALGFGPEAGAAFREVARRDGALRLDARIGEAAALRVRGRAREARAMLDEVLAGAQGPVRCRARSAPRSSARRPRRRLARGASRTRSASSIALRASVATARRRPTDGARRSSDGGSRASRRPGTTRAWRPSMPRT